MRNQPNQDITKLQCSKICGGKTRGDGNNAWFNCLKSLLNRDFKTNKFSKNASLTGCKGAEVQGRNLKFLPLASVLLSRDKYPDALTPPTRPPPRVEDVGSSDKPIKLTELREC